MLTDHHVPDLACGLWSVNRSHTRTHTQRAFFWAHDSLILWMVHDCAPSWAPASPLGFVAISRVELDICPSSVFLSWRCVMWLPAGWRVLSLLCRRFSRRLGNLLYFRGGTESRVPTASDISGQATRKCASAVKEKNASWGLSFNHRWDFLSWFGGEWWWEGGQASDDVSIRAWVIPGLTSSRTQRQLEGSCWVSLLSLVVNCLMGPVSPQLWTAASTCPDCNYPSNL